MPNSSPSYTTIGDMTRESLHSQTLEMETLAKMTALNRLFMHFFFFEENMFKDQKSNKIEAGTFQSQWSMGIEDFELLTVIGRGSYAKGMTS